MKSKAIAKVAAVATGLAMATSMLSFAPMVHAATLTSAQVSSILSLLSSFGASSATIASVNAALTGTTVTSGSTTTTTGNSACSFSRNLTIGSTGADVTCLQNGLIAGGFSIPAGATGYFGTQTRAAVASWQSSRNVAPAVGYFGAISRAAWNLGGSSSSSTTTTTTTTSTVAGCAAGAVFSATTGQACSGTTTTTTGALTGTGRLTNVVSLGNVTSDLKVGDAATSVMGISADATGGDVAIQRVDATFLIANVGSQSSNLSSYVSDVSLYLDGVKLASMDPTLGTKSTRTWTFRFSGLNGVIRSGQTGQLYVKVTPVSSIGTNEDAKTVTGGLAVDSIRAVAADGISDTYGVAVSQAFTVSSATVGALTATVGNDNPIASLVSVSSSTTSGVTLLTFNLKAKNQAVTITDLPVQIGTNDSLSDVISTVYLMKGSTVLSTKTVASGTFGTTTFTGINQTIAKDATVSYSIKVDLKGDSAYADNTTLVASTTVYGWDVSDADGATVAPSAAVVGNTLTLTATGITVVKGTPTASVQNGLAGKGDIATFTIPFTVTAGDTDVFIYSATPTKIAHSGTKTVANVNYATTTSSTAFATAEPTATFSAANVVTGDVTGAFKVLANTSRTFTFGATIVGSSTVSNGYVGVILEGIAYGPTATPVATYYTSGLDTFKTSDVFVSLR